MFFIHFPDSFHFENYFDGLKEEAEAVEGHIAGIKKNRQIFLLKREEHNSSSPLFRFRKPRPVGVVRDNGSAGQFSLAWSDGVLDDWGIGKNLTGYPVRKAKQGQVSCSLLAFQNSSLNSRLLPQHSITPTTQGPDNWLLAPFQGLQTKPCPLGVDSLLAQVDCFE